ncbi:MAG TPA: response regulator [Dokdonella sp.]
MPRLLVADDNPLSLRFLADAAAAAGVEVETAADGDEAVAHAQRTAFDLLLLDARMPGCGGAEALARIRAAAGPSRTAVALATTADDAAATQAALVAAGFAEVVVKPIAADALQTALARHLAPGAALDDAQALAAAGGDAGVVAALRGLFASELDALPDELAAFAARADAAALRERLHRLDASAGFCGAPALLRANARLRAALAAAEWPHRAVAEWLAACARVRALLSG